MSLPKFTPHMISNQPDQTAYLLNKLVQEGVSGTGGGGGDIHLYPGTGQHTDGAMTQKATTDALGLKADSSTVSAQLANKVDKEAGKGLSSNDFTDEDESKLDGIQAGAEVNVQADWDQADTSADDYIKNKPTIPVIPTNLMTTDTAQTVTGTKTFHNAEIATDNMITLKNNSTSLIRGMAGIEYRQLLKRGSTDVEVGNNHDPLALKGSGTRPKYNSNDLALYSDVPAAQVQSDWDQADNTAVDYIKNKPTIPAGAVLYPSTGQNTDGAMTQKASSDLFDNAVYIGTGSVGTPSPWVDTSDLVDGAVTTAKIDDGAVTTSKIADGDVTHAKLAEEAAIGRPIELFHGNNVDLNTMTESGIHRFYTPIANGPSGTYTYCSMLVMNYSDDYRCSQYFTGISDSGSGVIAVRFSFFYMGTVRTWSSWKIIAQWPD